MKYFFTIIFVWAIGFILPTLTPGMQIVLALLLLFGLIAGVAYYIDTRVNSVRINK